MADPFAGRLHAGRLVSLPPEEFAGRRARLEAILDEQGFDAFLGLSHATVQYLTGYALTPSERPFAVILHPQNGLTLVVPLLKEYDVAETAVASSIVTYPEYPDSQHPMLRIADVLRASGARRVLADQAGHESPYGYHGPTLEELSDLVVNRAVVERLRMTKSAAELALVRHAADWACFAHSRLQAATAPGRSESAIAGDATGHAMRRLRELYGQRTDVAKPTSVSASFGGQVGREGTAYHLQRALDPVIKAGDPLISRVGAFIGGYYADVERTMVVGQPGKTLRDLFLRGVEIQDYALSLIAPNRAVSEIDDHVRRRYAALGVAHAWRHHTGHSVGLLHREAPYLDIGSGEVLQPGMIVTVEPGLYEDGVGGFRHSDCVLITQTGAEILTPYPRELGALLC
jgi:Xaa-Pro dipeptidase